MASLSIAYSIKLESLRPLFDLQIKALCAGARTHDILTTTPTHDNYSYTTVLHVPRSRARDFAYQAFPLLCV